MKTVPLSMLDPIYEVLLFVYPLQTFPDSPGEKHRQKIAEILRLVVSYMRHTMHDH
jgi:hypothetical protein